MDGQIFFIISDIYGWILKRMWGKLRRCHFKLDDVLTIESMRIVTQENQANDTIKNKSLIVYKQLT
jgi:hypothetical protein